MLTKKMREREREDNKGVILLSILHHLQSPLTNACQLNNIYCSWTLCVGAASLLSFGLTKLCSRSSILSIHLLDMQCCTCSYFSHFTNKMLFPFSIRVNLHFANSSKNLLEHSLDIPSPLSLITTLAAHKDPCVNKQVMKNIDKCAEKLVRNA